MSPLKLLFLIAVPFNCIMMQFLLIGFHSVGKASKCIPFYYLLPNGAIFSGLVCKGFIKQILTLFMDKMVPRMAAIVLGSPVFC